MANLAGMENLARYITGAQISKSEFARDVGISAPYLSQILGGIRRPSLDVALRIAAATDGNVPVEAWGSNIAPPSVTPDALACADQGNTAAVANQTVENLTPEAK